MIYPNQPERHVAAGGHGRCPCRTGTCAQSPREGRDIGRKTAQNVADQHRARAEMGRDALRAWGRSGGVLYDIVKIDGNEGSAPRL